MVHLVHIVNSTYKYDEFTGVRSYSLKLKTEDNVMNFCLEICRQMLFCSIGVISVFFLNRGVWVHLFSLIRQKKETLSHVLQDSSEINSYANGCRF